MARGTLVGEAFIRVHADNSAFAREVATGMRGLAATGDNEGHDWGRRFFEGLKSELESKMEREFKQGFLTGDFTQFAKNFGSMDEALDTINQRLITMRRWGGLNEDQFADLSATVERFRRGIVNIADVRSMEDYAASLTKAAKEMGVLRDGSASASVSTDDLVRHMATWDDRVSKSRQGVDQWAATLTKAAEAMGHFREGTSDSSLNLRDLITQIDQGRDFEQLADRMSKAAREMGFLRDSAENSSISWREMRRHLDALDKSNAIKNKTRDVDAFNSGLGRVIGTLINLGRRVDSVDFGRMFGKGSRNDFLNIVGGVIGGITKLAEVITTGLVKPVLTGILKPIDLVLDHLATMDNSVGRTIGDLQEQFGGLGAVATKALGPVVSALAALVGVSIGVTGGISLLGEALAILTAIASNVAGAIVIAAGAIGVALVGAIGAAIPLVAALGAGITTLVIAFANMSEKTKGIFKPLQDGFTKIAKSVSDTFFRDAPKWVGSLTNLLTTFAGPTMTKVAGSIRDAITGILKDFQSAPIKKALKSWEDALGPIAGTLTTAIGKALEGITAFFVPLLPIAQEFANLLATIATNFANWAQSASGQNSIANFFNTAWERAKQLFSIIGQVTAIIGTLLRSGDSAAGKQFLGWLDDKLKQLRAFLDSAEGQNKLAEWFKQAQKFADLVWKAIEKVGEALGKLNTPQAQEFASKLIIGFGRLAEIIGNLAPVFDAVGKVAGFVLAGVLKLLGGMIVSAGQVAGVFASLFHLMAKAPGFGWLEDIATDLDGVSNSADLAGKALVGLPDQVQIDFNAQDTDLILAAQNAAGIVSGVEGNPATTKFDGNTDPLKTAVGDANKILEGPPGAPKTATTNFNGNLDQLVLDAAGATAIIANYNQSNVATTTFDGDTLPLVADIDAANRLIEANIKPTYETQFGGDTGLLLDSTVDANQIIDSVDPERITKFIGDPKPIHADAIQAYGEVLAVPTDWTTFFAGDPGPLTVAAAQANDEIISKAPQEWMTTFDGNTAPLFDATIDGNKAIQKVLPQWQTNFYGDTGALLDSTDAANAYIDGVHDIHSTEFGGDTGALLDATFEANEDVEGVHDKWLTNFTGDTGPLNKDALAANTIINGVQDFNQTKFSGDTGALSNAATDANRFIDRVYDTNKTTFDGNAQPVNNAAQQATKYVDGVPDNHVTTFTADLSGFIASVRYAKSLVNSLGEARVNQAGRAAGGIFGAMAGTILRGPQVILAGEDGPEAVVPLRRSLARVDPSVRELSAFAQGMMPGGAGVNIAQGAIQVTVPNSNPRLVAESVLDRLVARLS